MALLYLDYYILSQRPAFRYFPHYHDTALPPLPEGLLRHGHPPGPIPLPRYIPNGVRHYYQHVLLCLCTGMG